MTFRHWFPITLGVLLLHGSAAHARRRRPPQTSAAATAGPQRCPPGLESFVRGGRFASQRAAVHPNATIDPRASIDVDGDGRTDELVTLTRDEVCGSSYWLPVLMRRSRRGWTAEPLQPRGNDPRWMTPVLFTSGRPLLVVQSDETVSRYTLYQTPRVGSARIVYEDRSGTDEGWSFDPRPDGSVLVIALNDRTRAVRYRVLTWNNAHTALTAGPWSSRRP